MKSVTNFTAPQPEILTPHSPVEAAAAEKALFPKFRIIVADDHDLIRQGLNELLRSEYEIVAMVENGEQLVEAACMLHADALVIDISMPVMNGLDALRQLRKLGISAKSVMLTTHVSTSHARRALQSGAVGYVMKDRTMDDLPIALGAALEGRKFLSREVELAFSGSHV